MAKASRIKRKTPKKNRLISEVALGLALVAIAFGLGVQTIPRIVLNGVDGLAAVVASTLVDLTNTDRSVRGLVSLKINPLLVQAAQAKADDMATKGYFSHNSPDGTTPWYWFGTAGYDFETAGENLAIDFFESAEVESAWMNSPTHYANIVNESFTEIGIATAHGMYQGHQTTFVVQLFGKPTKDQSIRNSNIRTVASSDTFVVVTK